MQNYTADGAIGPGEDILVGRELANRNKNPHTHEFVEIIYILSGEGTEIINGKEYTVRRGDLLFVNFGESHAFKSSSAEFIHILLRPEFMSERLVSSENIFDIFALPAFSAISCTPQSSSVSFVGEEFAEITSAILAMEREYNQKRGGYRAMLFGYMQVVFTMLLRALNRGGAESSASEAERYISEHLFEKITLSDIAKNCFYNPSYFSRKFKSIFGKNLGDYLRDRRLKEAANLLLTTDASTTEIAEACAFSNKALFYRLFKESYGITPKEYRQSKKNK